MQSFKLNLKRRQTGKAGRRTLAEHDLRGVVYGHGLETMPVSGEARLINKVLDAAGTSHIIELIVDDGQPLNVLVKDLDHDPVTNELRHFDLHAVKKGEKIDVEVPVVLVGEAPAAKLGLVVHQLIDKLEVRTDPAHIPESFEIDVSGLTEVDDAIHVSDIRLPEGVELDENLLEQPIVKVDEVLELVVEDTSEVDVADVDAEHGGESDAVEGEEGEAASESGRADSEAEK